MVMMISMQLQQLLVFVLAVRSCKLHVCMYDLDWIGGENRACRYRGA